MTGSKYFASVIGRSLRPVLGRLKSLARDRRGAVAVFVAAGIIPFVALVGLAVDGARGYLVKARLSQALDAAALAGGRVALSENRDNDIRMYFAANFPQGLLGAEVSTPLITTDVNNEYITVTASATVETSFMRVLGYNEMNVSVRSVVKRTTRGMELVLVMDNTGSMSGSKIARMRDAATDLVNILYGNRETVPNFWVGVVPYSATVNIGTQHADWLASDPGMINVTSMARSGTKVTVRTAVDHGWETQDLVTIQGANQSRYNGKFPITVTGNREFTFRVEGSPSSPASGTIRAGKPVVYSNGSSWKGCVEARDFPYEESQAETLPGDQPWPRFYWTSNLDVKFWDDDNDVMWQDGDNMWPPVWEVPDTNESSGPNIGCGPPIVPLQASKTTALASIAGMAPWNRGGTMGNLGLAWGWRVLTPDWRGMWGAPTPETHPLDYNTGLTDKVVVMLTDGNNEWYDHPGELPGCAGISGCPDTVENADYTSYGRLSEGRLGTTNRSSATSVVNTRMTNLCSAMKAEGIIIYTIVLQVNNQSTQNLYRSCATRPEYYFLSPSADDLAEIFRQIATELSNLRLAQ